MYKITIIDDDSSLAILKDYLEDAGYEVLLFKSSDEVPEQLTTILLADLVILDLLMPVPKKHFKKEPVFREGGRIIYRSIREKNKDINVLLFTACADKTLINVLANNKNTQYLNKYNAGSVLDVLEKISKIVGKPDIQRTQPPIFIVHAHCDKEKLELKNYLQNTLNFPEPIILHEKPNLGRTLIEKFEDYALISKIVFVLLTPDDLVIEPIDDNNKKRRARQNVIFEMGYFLGTLGRLSGRVILLYKGDLDIPTDISGLTYIDITNGIASKSEEIRREIINVR